MTRIRQQGTVVIHKELDHPVEPDDGSGMQLFFFRLTYYLFHSCSFVKFAVK
jgi:hypothetical protein